MEDPLYLGVAKDESNVISKLVFYWVNPLIKKGRMGRLQSPSDVFELPGVMDTSRISQKFQATKDGLDNSAREGKLMVLRILAKCFGIQFLAIGILKFIADCAGFASPLLLNLLLTFMENGSQVSICKYQQNYSGHLRI